MKERNAYAVFGWAGWGIALLATLFLPLHAALALDVVTIKTSPATPGPGESVTIKLESFTTDLGRSQIVWYKDGDPVAEGPGLTSWNTVMPSLGGKSNIDIVILTYLGTRIDRRITLAPVEVDVLWEAEGITPPFYRGKALPAPNGKIKVAAIPRFNAKESDPSKFAYVWYVDRVKKVAEGLGKVSAIVLAPKAGVKMDITAKVSQAAGGGEGSKTVNVTSVPPKILFYESAPLLGVRFERALNPGGLTVDDDSAKIRAVPYFFSNNAREIGTLKYTWYIGGVSTPNPPDPEYFSIENGGSGGAWNIRLDMIDAKNVYQSASANTSISITPK